MKTAIMTDANSGISVEEGARLGAYVIPMSSGLSASCHAAMGLSGDYGGRVRVADNRRISVPQRSAVMDGADLPAGLIPVWGAAGADVQAAFQAKIFVTATHTPP